MGKKTAHSKTREADFKTSYYVDGNTVRRLEGEPQERRQRQIEREEKQERNRRRRAARRNQERAAHITMGYVAFCTAALAVTCGVCITYIQLQSDITSRTRSISKLESGIANLRAENDAAVKRIELTTDLDAVKEKAIEFGMKYAKEGQIIYYSVKQDDYMDQYSDIPKE